MNKIFMNIPTFTADYSGAVSVFYEMGGIHVICDASGCHGSTLILDEPRLTAGVSKVFSVSVREKDVVMGIDKKLKKQVKETWELLGGDYICLVGTPAPAIIGTDLNGLGRELEKELNIPVFSINSSGLEFYDQGQKKAYMALAAYSQKGLKTDGPDVSVIGATPLDMWDLNQIKDCMRLLRRCGAERPAVWGSSGKLDEIAGAGYAKLNIAVSASAVDVVKEMNRLYGTPYLIGFPIGRQQTEKWGNAVTELLRGQEKRSGWFDGTLKPRPVRAGRRALVVGEQIASNSLRELLRQEAGYEQVDVVSYFQMHKELMEEGDKKLVWEQEWTELLNEREPYELVAADPLFLAMLPYQPRYAVALPHIAVSSRAFWNQSPNLFGEKGTDYICGIMRK